MTELSGLSIQGFDQADAEEQEEEEATKETGAATAKKIAKKVAGNVIKGSIAGAPGFVFGIGGAVVSKGKQAIHDAAVGKGEGAIVTVKAVHVANLTNRTFKGPLKVRELPLTPVVRAKLVMEGFEGSRTNTLKISPGVQVNKKTMPNGKIVFKNQPSDTLLLPVGSDNLEALQGACLLVEVEDTPVALKAVAAIAKKAGKAPNLVVGTAILSLAQLLTSLDIVKFAEGESETFELPAKLELQPAGEVRIIVSITTPDGK